MSLYLTDGGGRHSDSIIIPRRNAFRAAYTFTARLGSRKEDEAKS